MSFKIIGICGHAGSGKDTIADWLCDKGFVKVSFADPMKRFAARLFGFTRQQLWGPSEMRNTAQPVHADWWADAMGKLEWASTEIREYVLDDYTKAFTLADWLYDLASAHPTAISPRVTLQTLGTEWGRQQEPLLWASYAHQVAKEIAKGHSYECGAGLIRPTGDASFKGVVIPDHRFGNEITLTKENAGKNWRIVRPGVDGGNVGLAGHRSEEEQRTMPDSLFDRVIVVPEGLGKLYGMLESIWKEECNEQ